jgi:EAL domain-containing protein (putative c-di-GMP-specific phosphodiesterase class I)/GGDEF domain-containing protein
MDNCKYEALNLFLDPVFIISKDYKIVYQNNTAKEKFGNLVGEKCYEGIYGFSIPCWHFNNYKCPIKESGKERIITQILDLTEKDNKLVKYFSRIYSPNDDIVEILIPYDAILKVLKETPKEISRDKYYLSRDEFNELLKKKIEQKKSFFLITLNIKGLKNINEVYGITAGDLVIKAVENVLYRLVGKYKFKLTQLSGGFWFLVYEEEGTKLINLEKELKHLLMNIEIEILGETLKPKITITTLEIVSDLIKDLNQIYQLVIYTETVRPADLYFFFSKGKSKEFLDYLERKQTVVKDIYKFLKQKRVTFYLQPIVNLKTKRIVFFEVLMRFIGDNGEIFPARKYIDAIYENHLIYDFDALLLDKLEEQLENLVILKRPISINVSDEDLKLFSYREKLKKLLEKFKSYGIKADIEITEQIMFKDFNFLTELAKWYKLKYTVDDFGTGYSSLKLVLELASRNMANKLKIDCSLVKNVLEDSYNRGLIETIVTFANKIGVKVVAECLETEEQYKLLKKLGVHYGQGWYFYKPVSLEEALMLIYSGK